MVDDREITRADKGDSEGDVGRGRRGVGGSRGGFGDFVVLVLGTAGAAFSLGRYPVS
jgi:hypothetical protein